MTTSCRPRSASSSVRLIHRRATRIELAVGLVVSTILAVLATHHLAWPADLQDQVVRWVAKAPVTIATPSLSETSWGVVLVAVIVYATIRTAQR